MSESLRDLVVSLSLNSDNFSRNIKSVTAQIKEAESRFALAGTGIKGFENTASGLGSKLSMLQQKMTLQKAAVDQYQRALMAANEKLVQSVANHDKTKSSLEQAKQKYTALGSEITRIKGEMTELEQVEDGSADRYVELGTELERLEKEYAATGAEVKKFSGALASTQKSMQSSADGVSSAQTHLNNAQSALKQTEAAITSCEKALRGLSWTQAGAGLTTFSKQATAAGEKLSSVGKSMTQLTTVPITALGATAIKSAISFESAFAGVRKTVDATEAEYAQLSKGIETLSTKIPASADSLAELMEAAGQLGIHKDALMGFTRVMTDMGNATNLAGVEGATQMAKFANITAMSQQNFDRLGSVIVRLGNNSATTEADIMALGMRLAGAGHQVGLTEAEIMAFSAALSSVGIEAEAGGSAFSKVMIGMKLAVETGKNGLDDFARVAGMSSDEFKRAFQDNAAAAIQAFIVGLSKMDEEGISAIKTLDDMGIKEVRLRDTLLRSTNASELFNNSLAMANDKWQRNTALTNEANQRYATTESQLQILKNQASLFMRTLGNDLMPTVKSLMGDIGGLMDSFMNLDAQQREVILHTGLMVAAAGPAISILGKVFTTTGQVTGALGKFASAVGQAGGGLSGFVSVIGSSKLAVMGLAVALGVGVYKFIDWASGAKAAREATEGMIRTAEEWANTQAKTIYDTGNDPFARFNVTKESFSSTKATEIWLNDLKRVWSDGKKESDETVTGFVDGFRAQSDAIRKAVEDRTEKLKGLGVTIPPEVEQQQEQQLAQLDKYDKEVEDLLKKRQSRTLSEKDQQRLDEIIELRAQLRLELKLDENGYQTIIENAKAEIARLAAAGEQPGMDLFGDAMSAAAKGRSAVNDQLDEAYIAEYKLIQAMDDEATKAAALAALDIKYTTDRKAAAEAYAQALAEIYSTTYTQPGDDGAENKIKTLTDLLNEFQIASASGDNTSGILQQMNELTKSMDEGDLAGYYAMLSQIEEALATSGKTAQELFPELPDPTKTLQSYQSLKTFLDENKTSFEGLQKMFSAGLEGEVQRVLVDLDLMQADETWNTWATDKIITVTGVDTTGATFTTLPETEALITFYQAAESAEIVSPKPETVAIISKYERGEQLTTDDINALVKAVVEGYEKNPNAEIPDTLNPLVIGLITDYKDNTTDAQKAALQPEFEALVTAWKESETGTGSKANLLQAMTAYITAYDDTNATKPDIQLTATVSPILNDIDAQRVSTWRQTNQQKLGELTAPVRLGLADDETTLNALKTNAVNLFGADGLPITLKPGVSAADVVTPDSIVLGADAEGRLNIIVVPTVGSPEGVAEAEKQLQASPNSSLPDWATMDMEDKIRSIQSMVDALKELEKTGDPNAVGPQMIQNIVDQLSSFKPEDLQNISVYIANAIAALNSGTVDPETANRLKEQLDSLQMVVEQADKYLGIGNDISAGIADGLKNYDWSADASTLATTLESALRSATQTQSPSQMTVPIGQGIAQGIGQGMAQVSLSGNAQTLGNAVTTALRLAMSPSRFSPIGSSAMSGLASGILSGSASVVSAIQQVASAAVQAAKDRLKIDSPSKVFEDEIGAMVSEGFAKGALAESTVQAKMIANAARYLRSTAQENMLPGLATDNRKTYTTNNSAAVNVERLVVNDKQDVRALAYEISVVQRRAQLGMGG